MDSSETENSKQKCSIAFYLVCSVCIRNVSPIEDERCFCVVRQMFFGVCNLHQDRQGIPDNLNIELPERNENCLLGCFNVSNTIFDSIEGLVHVDITIVDHELQTHFDYDK